MPCLVFMANLVWGAVATYCFYRAWMAVVGMVSCGIGLVRQRVPPVTLAGLLWNQILVLLFHGSMLGVAFAVCWYKLSLGRTPFETLAFLTTATAVMLVVLSRVSAHMDRIWTVTNAPEDGA